MRRNVIVYGLTAGVIVAVLMLAMLNYMSYCKGNVSETTSMVLGYAAMLIAFSLVFVGTRNYRDQYNQGVISFGKAFGTGALIVLIASTIYVVAWLIDYFVFVPHFMDTYFAHAIAKLKTSGASQAAVDEQINFARMYKNPFFNAIMTYAEILPVGLIVTLISAWILKKENTTHNHLKL